MIHHWAVWIVWGPLFGIIKGNAERHRGILASDIYEEFYYRFLATSVEI